MPNKRSLTKVPQLFFMLFFPTIASSNDTSPLSLDAHFIGTSHYIVQPDGDREIAAINIENSSLLVGLEQKLFTQGSGTATFGLRQTNHGLQFHQLHGAIQTDKIRVSIGLMELRNTIISFPSMRDNDLLVYTHMLNGEEDHHAEGTPEAFDDMAQLFGKSVSFSLLFPDQKQRVEIWSSEREGHGDYNTVGTGYFYEPPSSPRNGQFLQKAGMLIDRQQVAHHDAWLTAYIVGAEFNVFRNPTSTWSIAGQFISSEGSISTGVFDSYINMAKHSAYHAAGALRYTAHGGAFTRWQAALNVAAKHYHEVDNAWHWSILPSITYFLAEDIALTGQIVYTDYDEGINDGVTEVKYEFGMTYSLDNSSRKPVPSVNTL